MTEYNYNLSKEGTIPFEEYTSKCLNVINLQKTDLYTDMNKKIDYILDIIYNNKIYHITVDVKSKSANNLDIINISHTDRNGSLTHNKSEAAFYAIQGFYYTTPLIYFIKQDVMWDNIICNPSLNIQDNKIGNSIYYKVPYDEIKTRWSFFITKTGKLVCSQYTQYDIFY